MKNPFRRLAFAVALAGLVFAFDVPLLSAQTMGNEFDLPVEEAEARPSQPDQTVRKPSYRVHKTKSKRKRAAISSKTRSGKNLGMTVAEIKRFQREHGLKPDGIIGPKTRRAIEESKKVAVQPNPEVIGSTTIPTVPQEYAPDPNPEINQEQTPPLNGGSRITFSRFGHIDVTDMGGGIDRRYSVSVNGQQVLHADNQPSIIGVSKAYDLGNEDAVVITVFNAPDSAVCPYRNFVLVLSGAGGKLLELNSCTREYQARVKGSSLYIMYPDREDDRAVEATWRLDGQTLTKL